MSTYLCLRGAVGCLEMVAGVCEGVSSLPSVYLKIEDYDGMYDGMYGQSYGL